MRRMKSNAGATTPRRENILAVGGGLTVMTSSPPEILSYYGGEKNGALRICNVRAVNLLLSKLLILVLCF